MQLVTDACNSLPSGHRPGATYLDVPDDTKISQLDTVPYYEQCFPDVRVERPSLTELPLCEKHGLVWVIPTPAADGSIDFDVDPWLGGLGPELASYGFQSWVFFDKRVIPERMNWKILVDTFHEGYHIGFLHRKSLDSQCDVLRAVIGKDWIDAREPTGSPLVNKFRPPDIA